MKLKINQDFPYFHKGYERREYVKGDVVESDDEEFIAVATNEGWAEEAGKSKKGGAAKADDDKKPDDTGKDGEKSNGDSPEDKAKSGAPENKGKK